MRIHAWCLPLPLTLIPVALILITFRVNKICSNDRESILKARNKNQPSIPTLDVNISTTVFGRPIGSCKIRNSKY